MKVLFISSGKSGNVGYVVRNQGESLKTAGVDLDYYLIKPGLLGYLTSIPKIRKAFRRNNYNLAHAHYSFSGFAATLAGCKPLVVSLMGSDIFMSKWLRRLAMYFSRHRWNATIVKTLQMKEVLNISTAHIIPNGVDINRFQPKPKQFARSFLNYPEDKKLIIFISSPNRPEKNSELAFQAVGALQRSDVELKHVYDVPNSEIPNYLNAADVLILTSKWEGSVNVIKEAMGCNCPVVATDVGDVSWLFGNEPGYYIAGFYVSDFSEKLKTALNFSESHRRTNGRERIFDIGLDSRTIAHRIIEIYKKLG